MSSCASSIRKNRGRVSSWTLIVAFFLVGALTSSFSSSVGGIGVLVVAAAAAAPEVDRTNREQKGDEKSLYQIRFLPQQGNRKSRREAIVNQRRRLCHHILATPPCSIRRSRKHNAKSGLTEPRNQGTMVSIGKRPPTQETVSRWFWGTSPIRFNHPFVGMTSPYLRIEFEDEHHEFSVDSDDTISKSEMNFLCRSGSANQRMTPIPASSLCTPVLRCRPRDQINEQGKVHAEETEDSLWWPQGSWKSLIPVHRWRVLCLRQRVGYGSECYERVKEAALQFEFGSSSSSSSASSNKGIVSVVPPRSQQRGHFLRFPLPEQQQQQQHDESFPEQAMGHKTTNAVSIWSGGGRRLATFARWGPRLWAVSPVSVVYEVVDQVAPPSSASSRCNSTGGDVYSCAAFGTLKGHWIRGEERVTVAWRRNSGAVDVEIFSLSQAGPGFFGTIAWPLLGRLQKSFFVQHLQSLQHVGGACPQVIQHPLQQQLH